MNSKCEPIEAWHFLKSDKKLGYASGREIYPGQTIKVKGQLRPCAWGLHASIKATDALRYAPGPIICRVLCSDEIIQKDDKICARKRKCLWMADTTKVLQKFSLDCLEFLLENSNRSTQDIENINNYRDYFQGKISKDTFNSNCHLLNDNGDCYKTIPDLIHSYGNNALYLARQSLFSLLKSNFSINSISKIFEDLLWTLKP
jgi:hypothetical protein